MITRFLKIFLVIARLTRKPAMTVILWVFACVSLNIQAQDMVAPMDIPLFLSGNFGELRNNHFHSGDDFKTQGVTGIPVKSVKDGYVSRIGVSPYGYGNVLYIDHPDGTTSVYGHLERFIPRIESVVRDSQYLKESFTVNLYFQPGQLPVKKGERIAWSGNTGGSGGPHLHFEFRETESEKAIDPLPYFKNRVKDTRPPEIRGIMLFPQPGKGIANGSAHNQPVTLLKDKAGNQSAKQPVTAWGQIGVGVKAYDRMSETTNIYGVNEIILKVDGSEVYHSVMNKFPIDDTRYLNTYIDWKEWTENNSFYMKSFTDPGNHLGVNRAQSNGIIDIDKEKIYHLEYILKDVYGNAATFRFDITGKKAPIPPVVMNGSYFPQNKDNEFYGQGIDLKIPQNNLYSDIFLKTDFVPKYTPFAPLYILGERLPLHSYCPLTLEITNDTYPDKSKYGIVQVLKNKRNWIGGEYEDGKITGKIRELGRYTIDVDTVPPVITPVNPAKWETNRRIAFKITDDLSGIASYRGTMNGEFILFQYDYKTNSLYHEYDSKRAKYGNGTLRLVVADEAGNQSEWFK
ncbi:MAG: M23 family metallopeptidase [Candidatus Symbiothrix sp.]|nr:M23 family metallopeptidase [Candidatus Symbiothrix sp.]